MRIGRAAGKPRICYSNGFNAACECSAGESSVVQRSVLDCSMTERGVGGRDAGHVPDQTANPGTGESRRRGIALGAERPIAGVVRVVFANVVFTGEGMFEVPIALVKRGTLRTAALAVVHTGSHICLAFDYGTE
jgi:hypothetical protein